MTAARDRLSTFLHVSDLHVGTIDPVTGDAHLSLIPSWIFHNLTWFDGVLGHHARGLQDLADFYDQIRDLDPMLLVTGDMTRVGHPDEWDVSNQYLSSTVNLTTPPNQAFAGLRCPYWKNTAILGNHDHWCGQPVVFGSPSPGLAKYFPPNTFPHVFPKLTLRNGRDLILIRINTDADVGPYGQRRLRAVGAFQSQLAKIATSLGKRPDNEIRVLLMHHSWHKRKGMILSIARATRAALDQFLVDCGIQVVLTGHTHNPLVETFIPEGVTGGSSILECRSGTTTQLDRVPLNWQTVFGTFPAVRWPVNTLIVHTLFADGDDTVWESQVHHRTRDGFVSSGPDAKWHRQIKV